MRTGSDPRAHDTATPVSGEPHRSNDETLVIPPASARHTSCSSGPYEKKIIFFSARGRVRTGRAEPAAAAGFAARYAGPARLPERHRWRRRPRVLRLALRA